jgi:hypothetical protein
MSIHVAVRLELLLAAAVAVAASTFWAGCSSDTVSPEVYCADVCAFYASCGAACPTYCGGPPTDAGPLVQPPAGPTLQETGEPIPAALDACIKVPTQGCSGAAAADLIVKECTCSIHPDQECDPF